jgi:hypothetical protein
MTIRPAPKPAKQKKGKRVKYASPRKRMEIELEALLRELCNWRDGGACVLRQIDGGRCGGSIQWGHFLARQRSSYLVFAIGNSFCQCANHNLLHKVGDHIFGLWYDIQFGTDAHNALLDCARRSVGKKPTIWELQDWIARVKYLLDDRPALYTLAHLVELGYYGIWPQQFGLK